MEMQKKLLKVAFDKSTRSGSAGELAGCFFIPDAGMPPSAQVCHKAVPKVAQQMSPQRHMLAVCSENSGNYNELKRPEKMA